MPMAARKPLFILRKLRLAALLTMLYGISQLVLATSFYQDAIETDGIILEFTPHDAPFNPSSIPLIAFIDFTGKKFLVSPDNALDTQEYSLGQRIGIVYDGYAPENMRVNSFLGIWGIGTIWLLIGFVPWFILSIIIGGASKATRRPSPRQRANAIPKSTIKAQHLLGHDPDATDRDTPVVRRMR